MASRYVVTVTPTIMSGTVVRWFTDLAAAEQCRPFLSASRYDVITHLEGIVTPELRDQANAVQDALQGEGQTRQWVRHLATHQRRGITGPFVRASHVPPAEPDAEVVHSAECPSGDTDCTVDCGRCKGGIR